LIRAGPPAIAEADYYTIPETAHFLMMRKPIEFNRMLLKFVEKFK